MSKFKVGDRVIAVYATHGWGGVTKGDIGEVRDINISGSIRVNFPGQSHWIAEEGDLSSVTKGGEEVKPYHRKTYRQLKEDATVKKGALWQEMCDDGTQPYKLMDASYHKDGRSTPSVGNRSLIETQGSWFVEVFAVTPQYMTREELDQWEAFKSAKNKYFKLSELPKGKAVEVRLNGRKIKQATSWTPERKAAHSRRMKKMWKARRAA